MNQVLKLFYGIETDLNEEGYFVYQNQIYYLLSNPQNFFQFYPYYRYYMSLCHYNGYQCIKNYNDDLMSQNYILLQYNEQPFDLQLYLNVFLQPYEKQIIPIKQIKEEWIYKTDQVKQCIKKYAYSYKHQPDLVSLIYYYVGLSENCICLLNEIMLLDKHASLSTTLSLKHPIQNYVYDLLNPIHYVLSTRVRHIVYLLKSDILQMNDLSSIIEAYHLNLYEILYLYARYFYPGYFFDMLLEGSIGEEHIKYFFNEIEHIKENYQQIYRILSIYVALPKISWINRRNML